MYFFLSHPPSRGAPCPFDSGHGHHCQDHHLSSCILYSRDTVQVICMQVAHYAGITHFMLQYGVSNALGFHHLFQFFDARQRMVLNWIKSFFEKEIPDFFCLMVNPFTTRFCLHKVLESIFSDYSLCRPS